MEPKFIALEPRNVSGTVDIGQMTVVNQTAWMYVAWTVSASCREKCYLVLMINLVKIHIYKTACPSRNRIYTNTCTFICNNVKPATGRENAYLPSMISAPVQ